MRAEVFDSLTLIRINAPEIYQDPAFKEWFLNRPPAAEGYQPPTMATWHRPGEKEFGEYSDFFMTVEFLGGEGDDDFGGDGSESDMPEHIWNKLLRAAWEALGKPSYYIEAFVWVSNLDEGPMKPQEHMVWIRDELLAKGFTIAKCELLKNLLDRCEIWLDHLHLDARDFVTLSRLGMANVRADLHDGKVCWVAQFYGPGHRIRPDVKVPPPIPSPEDPNIQPTPDPETDVPFDDDRGKQHQSPG